jgi:predicted transcriptional regulator
MKLKEVIDILEAEALVGEEDLDREIRMACASDLMSDVLAFMHHDSLLLTGLVNPQSVRTAEVSDIVAICYVRGKRPPDETVELAREKGVILLATDLFLFDSCGRLYQAGVQGTIEPEEDI